MKIIGNLVGTTQKPEQVLVKSKNLTEEEKAQARANIGIGDILTGDVANQINIQGGISSGATGNLSAGDEVNTADVKEILFRSDYIAVKKGDIVKYSNMGAATNFAVITVYDINKAYVSHKRGQGNDIKLSGEITIEADGYIRLCNKQSSVSLVTVELKNRILVSKKTLNILVIGNSFSQDSFAYLPPVLNEILPDYAITYGVAYRSGTSVEDYVTDYINKGEAITFHYFNYWKPSDTRWDRQSGKSLTEVMAMQKWDIIYLQTAGPQNSIEVINKNVITPVRTMLRLLQELNGSPFSLMLGQHLAVSNSSFANLCNGMQKAKEMLGIYDYIPIGTAFENARTNETLKLLGENRGDSDGNYKDLGMLYNTHMQAGIPALLATYTVAIKILQSIGEEYRGIYNSTFVPTDDVCVAINASDGSGETYMTHGYSHGVTAENIKLIQEYAYLAVNNPTRVSDGITAKEETDGDLQEIVDAVLEALPTWEGGSY